MRCAGGNKIVDLHATRDQASPGAAAGPLKTAAFKPGTRAQCKCAAGECSEAQCDELRIMDADNNKLATFHGKGWQAHSDAKNPLVVYRMPGSATQDARRHKVTISDIQEWNRAAYSRPDIKEEER
jgi:hypothetical protein